MDTLNTGIRLFKFIILGTAAFLCAFGMLIFCIASCSTITHRPAAATKPDQRQEEAERNARLWRNLYTTSQLQAETPPPTKFTLDQFNRLRIGATYRDVTRALDAPGTVLSETTIMGYTTVILQWSNDNPLDGNITAEFQGGRLISKAQFGLK